MEVQLLRSGSFTQGMAGSTQVALHNPVKCTVLLPYWKLSCYDYLYYLQDRNLNFIQKLG